MEQRFCVSRVEDAKFVNDKFRTWLCVRDLGLEEATHGQFAAHVTRAGELGHTTGPHYHEMNFQIIYVLRGWVKLWYEGEGEFVLKAGDFVYHPPAKVHDLRAYSEDMEILEIYAPARPATIDSVH